MSISPIELRNLAARRIRENAQPVYNPPKYICVYNAESRPGFPPEFLFRTIDAGGLLALITSLAAEEFEKFHLYLIRHDKPPVAVDYLLHPTYLGIYDRSGTYIERRKI